METKTFLNTLFLSFILLFSILVCGCQSVSEDKAEKTALLFLQERVKFYTTEENKTVGIPQYNMEIVDSYKSGDDWSFIVLVSSTVDNETKQAKMKVVVDGSKNDVISFDPKIE